MLHLEKVKCRQNVCMSHLPYQNGSHLNFMDLCKYICAPINFKYTWCAQFPSRVLPKNKRIFSMKTSMHLLLYNYAKLLWNRSTSVCWVPDFPQLIALALSLSHSPRRAHRFRRKGQIILNYNKCCCWKMRTSTPPSITHTGHLMARYKHEPLLL